MKKLLILLVVVATMTPSLVGAKDCLDYGDYLHWVGAVDTPGEAMGVAIAGNYAYVADW